VTVATDGEVILDHGTGAKLSQQLLEVIVAGLGEAYAGEMEDSAVLPVDSGRIAVTTDSFVVDPPFFGNGDIGKVAVCGTVNDLAVMGAEPRYLTLGMILEAGLPISLLARATASVRVAALEAGVTVVAGDTKVVRFGEADRLYLNTAGVGVLHRPALRMRDVRPGDRILLSGQLGNHTVHLLSIREGLGFETRVLSDCAPLNGLLAGAFDAVPAGAVRSVRDVTRGGLAAVLHEYAVVLDRRLRLEASALPIQAETRMAAEMLGIDPVHCANEGCACLFVAPEHAETVLAALRAHPYGRHAVPVGVVTEQPGAAVELRDHDGRASLLEELEGAELPRLC
jgi:hydrogenase expression/formation protein HypE